MYVGIYVCIYMCIFIYGRVCMCVYLFTYLCMHYCVSIFVCNYEYLCRLYMNAYISSHVRVCVHIIYVCSYTYVCTQNYIPFPQSALQEICVLVISVTLCRRSLGDFPIMPAFLIPWATSIHVNSGFEVWDEECLNEPLVVDVTRGWGLMTAPEMNILWESDPILTTSSAGKGRTCRLEVLT